MGSIKGYSSTPTSLVRHWMHQERGTKRKELPTLIMAASSITDDAECYRL